MDTQGDAFFAVFAHAADALAFAADIQAGSPRIPGRRAPPSGYASASMPARPSPRGPASWAWTCTLPRASPLRRTAARCWSPARSPMEVAAVGPDPAARTSSPPLPRHLHAQGHPRPGRAARGRAPGTPADLPPPRTLDEVIEPPTPGDPPYPGLVAFEEADAGRFFGRETLVTELADRLDAAPFLAVVGASGSGKSSVVRAGLVPALRARLAAPEGDPGAHEPRVVLLTPTEDPVAELVAALGGLGGPPDAVVVDQFEELFTVCRDDAARNAFVDRLLALLDAGSRVVVVLRADLYDRLAAFDRLRSLASEHQAYLGPMSPAELRRAIEGPAEAGGWQLDPGLVDLIIGDLGDEPGGLPLLSHALRETWERRWGTRLTLRGYLDSGGVQGAIARTADRVVETLQGADLARTRAIFLRLTELGSETPDTRRRAPIAELVHARDDAADRRVLDRLVAARLVVADDRTVEVAHEALIREWPLLREWLEEDREAIRLRRAVTDAATDWERAGADPSHLLRGARLAAVSEWLRARPDDASDLERRFVTASVAAAEAETAEREAARQRELDAARRAADAERARADEAARSARRTRRAAAALVGLLVAAVGLAGYAVIQSRRADEQRQVAEDQTRVAEQQTDAAQEQRGIADGANSPRPPALLETDWKTPACCSVSRPWIRPGPPRPIGRCATPSRRAISGVSSRERPMRIRSRSPPTEASCSRPTRPARSRSRPLALMAHRTCARWGPRTRATPGASLRMVAR
ncbi:MAG: ATP-binding protein [Chloroflexota bacterium]